MPRLPKTVFIVLSLVISFFVSSFLYIRYFDESSQFDTVALKNDVDAIVTSVTAFHFEFPRVTLFSQRIENPSPTPLLEETPYPTRADNAPLPTETPSPSFDIPTSTPYIQPTKQAAILPTYSYQPIKIPTKPPIITSTIAPTQTPKPTKPPKPTKAPDIFPVDPSLQRPGKTSDEVFTIAAQKTCTPKEVLRAIASIESGGFFDVVDPKWFNLYNSYNWWKSPFLTDVKRACGGYDYDGNTGIIPADSNFAGQTCPGAQGGNLVVRGPMSVSDYWEGKFKPPAAKLLQVPQVDQRVILDAIVIVALSIKENVKPANCNSWTAHDIVKAACSYYGSCTIQGGGNYCTTFCNNITKYGGKNCSSAVSQFANGCYN